MAQLSHDALDIKCLKGTTGNAVAGIGKKEQIWRTCGKAAE